MVDFILSAVQSVLCSWWNVSSSFSFLSVMTFPVVLLLIYWSVVFVQLLILCVCVCVFFQAFWFLNCLFCFLKSRALAQGFMVTLACICTYFSRILILMTEEKCEGSTQVNKVEMIWTGCQLCCQGQIDDVHMYRVQEDSSISCYSWRGHTCISTQAHIHMHLIAIMLLKLF